MYISVQRNNNPSSSISSVPGWKILSALLSSIFAGGEHVNRQHKVKVNSCEGWIIEGCVAGWFTEFILIEGRKWLTLLEFDLEHTLSVVRTVDCIVPVQ